MQITGKVQWKFQPLGSCGGTKRGVGQGLYLQGLGFIFEHMQTQLTPQDQSYAF